MKDVVGPGTTWRGRARSLEASAGTASYPADGVAPMRCCSRRIVPCSSPSGPAAGASRVPREGVALAGEFKLQTPTPIDPLGLPA